jgi:hypothetical protein
VRKCGDQRAPPRFVFNELSHILFADSWRSCSFARSLRPLARRIAPLCLPLFDAFVHGGVLVPSSLGRKSAPTDANQITISCQLWKTCIRRSAGAVLVRRRKTDPSRKKRWLRHPHPRRSKRRHAAGEPAQWKCAAHTSLWRGFRRKESGRKWRGNAAFPNLNDESNASEKAKEPARRQRYERREKGCPPEGGRYIGTS